MGALKDIVLKSSFGFLACICMAIMICVYAALPNLLPRSGLFWILVAGSLIVGIEAWIIRSGRWEEYANKMAKQEIARITKK